MLAASGFSTFWFLTQNMHVAKWNWVYVNRVFGHVWTALLHIINVEPGGRLHTEEDRDTRKCINLRKWHILATKCFFGAINKSCVWCKYEDSWDIPNNMFYYRYLWCLSTQCFLIYLSFINHFQLPWCPSKGPRIGYSQGIESDLFFPCMETGELFRCTRKGANLAKFK